MEKEYEHAYTNAKGWFEEIRDSYRAFLARREDSDNEGGKYIEERMRKSVLAVKVREPWHDPSVEKVETVEYHILLTTVGPALRVYGDIGPHGEPENAQLQIQDWGVPWREVWPCEVNKMDEAREALMWFAGLFYYGD